MTFTYKWLKKPVFLPHCQPLVRSNGQTGAIRDGGGSGVALLLARSRARAEDSPRAVGTNTQQRPTAARQQGARVADLRVHALAPAASTAVTIGRMAPYEKERVLRRAAAGILTRLQHHLD